MHQTQLNESPPAPFAPGLVTADNMEQLTTGQRLVIYALMLHFFAAMMRDTGPGGIFLALALGLTAIVLSIVGILRLSSGMGMSPLTTALMVILCFVPIVNLIVLLILNARATKALRAAAYTFGLFGAST